MTKGGEGRLREMEAMMTTNGDDEMMKGMWRVNGQG